MGLTPPHSRLWEVLWFLAWAIASSVWCVTAAGRLGATFDEPFYISRGLEHWRTGSYRELLRLGTMPLPVDVQTLPLYFWECCRGSPLDVIDDWDSILPWARGATLSFWWLLLLYGWRSARLLGGPWAARLGVALLAAEPVFLAHAGLATTDVAVTACLLALCFHFRAGRDDGWRRRLLVPAVWFAAAVLAKASAMVFGPLCLVMIELDRLARSGAVGEPASLSRLARLRPLGVFLKRDLACIVLGGFLLVFLYCGSDWQRQRSFASWAHQLPEGWIGGVMAWLADHLCIFPNAGDGLMRQVMHNIQGNAVFLLGQTDYRALWYYFPVVLTIKLSLPILLGITGLLLTRPRALANWACLTAAALLLFSLTCRVQLGIRMILPLVALAVVGLAAGAVQFLREWAPRPRRWGAIALALGVSWTTGAAILVWPNGLSYVNELWGGTSAGYRVVSESNYDWGQGLKELARWRQANAVVNLDVWYFGTDPSFSKLAFRESPLPGLPLTDGTEVLAWERGHWLAVSTTVLYGYPITDAHRRATEFLRSCRPAARTTTFLVYDFTRISVGGTCCDIRGAAE
jgi:hypothetical protein